MKQKPSPFGKTFRRLGLLTVVALVGYGLARLLSKTVEPEETLDGPPQLIFIADERRYPPFRDTAIEGLQLEGERNEDGERQIALVGVPLKEVRQLNGVFAIARQDATALWHPAATEDTDLPPFATLTQAAGDVAVIALYVGASEQHLALGSMQGNRFTPYKQTRLIALTIKDGLSYDYPTVPLARIQDSRGAHRNRVKV